MKKILFFHLLLLTSLTFSQGQSNDLEVYFRHQIDSLDKIQPTQQKIVKPFGCKYSIHISNQKEFDIIEDLIKAAIGKGKNNIRVRIKAGVYHFHENHVVLKNIRAGEVSISIEGEGAIVTSDESFSSSSYSISPWRELTYADDYIEVVDKEKKLCRIPYKNNLASNEKPQITKVQVTQWYRAPVYSVYAIDEDGVSFIAPDMDYIDRFKRKGYSVNYDYLFGNKTPRFRLYDSRLERRYTASRFMYVENCDFRIISIKGVLFKGNKGDHALIVLKKLQSLSINISDSEFDCIRGKVISIIQTDNVFIRDNMFKSTYGNEVSFSDDCKNVRITGNLFDKCGQTIGNTFCIRCNEGVYYIANNTFSDFGYGAIGVGLWHGHEKKHISKGIVENNEIYFTPDYFNNREKYTLMDGGAIYVCTQNDDVIIRNNYIHDYGGAHSNHGIYCDDGASNCKIYGNVILNIPDGRNITSRKVADQKNSFKNNANNFMAYNILDGTVVFAGYGEEERHCQKGANFVIQTGTQTEKNNKFENLELMAEDIIITDLNGKVIGKQIKKCTGR